MFESFKDFFEGSAPLRLDKAGKPAARDVVIATVIVLLELAHQDKEFSEEEFTQIIRGLNREFGLSDAEAGMVMEIADYARKNPERGSEATRVINEHFSDEQKEHILSMLWRVVLADGLVDAFETRYAVLLRTRLNLSLEQAVRARTQAEQELD
ncbi:MAG: TerB family tellurite resistance protein [Bdellovibrionales bacterium]|nr:TerB family tellurite resistance protein [Bdellovibrionales bacterium]